jgi:hypothetical protein
LKEKDVSEFLELLDGAASRRSDGEPGHAPRPFRVPAGEDPRDGAAPVVPDDVSGSDLKRVEKPRQVPMTFESR